MASASPTRGEVRMSSTPLFSAGLAAKLKSLSERGVWIGTSSWKYPSFGEVSVTVSVTSFGDGVSEFR
jgi:hypothetical protein